MSKTDRRIRLDYAREVQSVRPMPTWTRIVLVLVLLGAVLALADLTLDVLARNDYPMACPDGKLPTAWCGCDAPIYGDDC